MVYAVKESDLPELWRHFEQTGCEKTRAKLIVAHQNLVRFLALKFINRGIPLEDLVQVGNIGLINAVDRYDPERGTQFSTYATATIVGEIRRHFRDKGWVKVPRRLRGLNQLCIKVESDLLIELGHEPTAFEIAERIGISEEEVNEALDLGIYYCPASLENGDNSVYLGDFLGAEDPAMESIVEQGELRSAIERLGERERFIIIHRFFSEES